MTTSIAPRHERAKLAIRPISLALFYLGLALPLAPWVDVGVQDYQLSLFVAFGLALLGWLDMVVTPSLKRYLTWAVVLGVWIAITAIAAWAYRPIYHGGFFAAWLVFVIPGLASLLRDRHQREAFVGGLAIGATVFAIAGALRLIRGDSLFDVNEQNPEGLLLGFNRNGATVRIFMVLPFLIAGHLPRPLRPFRWPMVALCLNLLVFSGSRGALIGLVLTGLVWVLLQQRASNRVRAIYAAALVATMLVVSIQELGGQAAVSMQRILGTNPNPERTASDEIRRLLLRRAWHHAMDNPIFGIGPGRFVGTYHPVVEEATTLHVRHRAINEAAHNGFAGQLAESGFLGLFLYIGLVAVVLVGGVRNRGDPAVRVATVAFVSILFMILVGLDRDGPFSFHPIALVLGTLIAAADTKASDRGPELEPQAI